MILKTEVNSPQYSICNIRLDDPWLTLSNTTQNSVELHFSLKFFFACGTLTGASPSGTCLTPQESESGTQESMESESGTQESMESESETEESMESESEI